MSENMYELQPEFAKRMGVEVDVFKDYAPTQIIRHREFMEEAFRDVRAIAGFRTDQFVRALSMRRPADVHWSGYRGYDGGSFNNSKPFDRGVQAAIEFAESTLPLGSDDSSDLTKDDLAEARQFYKDNIKQTSEEVVDTIRALNEHVNYFVVRRAFVDRRDGEQIAKTLRIEYPEAFGDADLDEVFDRNLLDPIYQYYEGDVPDDLEERAASQEDGENGEGDEISDDSLNIGKRLSRMRSIDKLTQWAEQRDDLSSLMRDDEFCSFAFGGVSRAARVPSSHELGAIRSFLIGVPAGCAFILSSGTSVDEMDDPRSPFINDSAIAGFKEALLDVRADGDPDTAFDAIRGVYSQYEAEALSILDDVADFMIMGAKLRLGFRLFDQKLIKRFIQDAWEKASDELLTRSDFEDIALEIIPELQEP